MNLIFLGAPGSGKGTQAEALIKTQQLTHLSTGDMLRSEIAKQTPLGMAAKKIMDEGGLVSDEIVINMIANCITDQGALFDGFPRTIAQAQALDELLAKHQQQIDHVIYLDVATDVIMKRMLARGRADDNETTIRQRLEVYQNQTQPLIEFYQKQGKLRHIIATGTIEEINQQILQAIA